MRHVALLRGINVGRAKRIAMADLRKLIEDLGYSEVKSLLNSGNIVFSGKNVNAAKAAAAIEETLVLKLGVAARVTVLSALELAEVVQANTLVEQASDHARLLVFLFNRPGGDERLAGLAAQDWAPEALLLGQRAAYLWAPGGVLASRAGDALGKLLGDSTTARNWNTISKLYALASA